MTDIPPAPPVWNPAAALPGASPGPAMSPSPPPPPRSRLGLAILVGLAIGLLIGGGGGFLAGWFVGSPGELTINGSSSSSGSSSKGGYVETFDYDEAKPPKPESTREAPVPVGTKVDLGNGWTVKVTSFEPDADRLVADSGGFGEPPSAGKRFVLVGLEATYVQGKKDAISPFFGLDLSLLGSGNVARKVSDENCQAPEPRFDELTDLYKGGTAAGLMCVAVGIDEVDSLVLVVEPGLTFDAVKSYLEVR